MLLSIAIFLAERTPGMIAGVMARDLTVPIKMAAILLLGLGVNALCVLVLFHLRRLDRTLMNADQGPTPLAGADLPR